MAEGRERGPGPSIWNGFDGSFLGVGSGVTSRLVVFFFFGLGVSLSFFSFVRFSIFVNSKM